MKDTVYTDVERQTASGKGGPSSKRGKLLYAVETDRKRIGLDILIRLAVSAFAVVVLWFRGTAMMIAAAVALAGFCAWPLLHMGDRMELYENGILYLGQWYPVGAGTKITWVGGRGFLLPTTWLGVGGCRERINVSFMKDAEKLFNRAYNNAIYAKGE